MKSTLLAHAGSGFKDRAALSLGWWGAEFADEGSE